MAITRLNNNSITSITALPSGCTSASGLPSGVTEADQWRINSSYTISSANTYEFLTANFERNDSTGYTRVGTGMTQSGGVFTFPSTGIYHIEFNYRYRGGQATVYAQGRIYGTTDNSTYSALSTCDVSTYTSSADTSATTNCIFDVTDTSTHKVKFAVFAQHASSGFYHGDNTSNGTYFTFLKLGNT